MLSYGYYFNIPLKPGETKTEIAKLKNQNIYNLKQLRGKFKSWSLEFLLPAFLGRGHIGKHEASGSDLRAYFTEQVGRSAAL